MKFINKSYLALLFTYILSLIATPIITRYIDDVDDLPAIFIILVVAIVYLEIFLQMTIGLAIILLSIGRLIYWNIPSRLLAYKIFAIISLVLLSFVDFAFITFSFYMEDIISIIISIILTISIIWNFISIITYKEINK